MSATATVEGITSLSFFKKAPGELAFSAETNVADNSAAMRYLIQLQLELDEYFSKIRKKFTVPVHLSGTPFQRMVWEELRQIPFGEVRTYLQLARKLKDAGAVRAVAGANARNPVMILIPCHRVNGTNGSLTGYAGGLHAKKFLLELESGKKIPKQYKLEFPVGDEW